MKNPRHDFHGTEFDWFAHDLEGFVAVMSSAGSGRFPALLAPMGPEIDAVLEAMGIHYRSPASSRAPGLGFYAYDTDMNGGPYRRTGAPQRPRRLEDLTGKLRDFAECVAIDGRFRELTAVGPTQFRYLGWSEANGE